MKRYFGLVLALCLAAVTPTRGQGLDDQYVQIFTLIQEADTLSSTQPAKALARYLDAQTSLQRMQKGSPDWNPKVVSFRLSYVAAKIAALSTNAPAAEAPAPDTNKPPVTAGTNAPAPPAGTPAAAPVQPPALSDLELQVNGLKDQVRQLQAERMVMEAKLKEALSMQPAATDPRELARAEEKVKSLQKENDLLKTSLETEKSKPAPPPDTKALDQAQQALAQEKELNLKLTTERDALLTRIKSLGSTPDAAALLAENQLLKQRLAATPTAHAAPAKTDEATQTGLQAQIAALQSDKELLRLEKIALENRVKQLSIQTAAAGSAVPPAKAPDAVPQQVAAESPSRIRQLEREREDLQKKLDAANKSLASRKGNGSNARVQQLELALASAHAKLDVLEARRVPYTAEELALLKTPDTKLAEAAAAAPTAAATAAPPPNPVKKAPKELPPGSARLVAEAQSWFSSRQYDKAESAYKDVVQMDQKNVPALANLAAIQIEKGSLDNADKNIKAALAEDPEDPFSLYILGILKFRQAKFDDSLEALSHAAKLDPENPEVQNYLGLALSEKGQRVPAETALRKAIQLQPNYGGAHYNLAIVYLSQQPPAFELARWHYQKAVLLGHAKNADMEKKLEAK